MTDEQIHEYLKSRAQGTPPADIVDGISRAVAGTPQQPHSWTASLLPAAAVAGLAAAVLATVLFVGEDPDVGPQPTPTPSAPATPTPDPSVVSRPSPAPTASADSGSLTDPGGILTMPAQDEEGRWGTVTMERLPDLGGLREIVQVDLDDTNPDPSSMYFVNDPAMFYLDVAVEYLAEREPDPLDFGSDDWTVLGGPEPISPIQVGFDALGSHLPGAMAIVGDPIRGILRFEIPRALTTDELRLAYQPVGFDNPVWVAPLRLPGDPPEAFEMIPPTGTGSEEEAAAQRERMVVTANAQAEALFATPDTCTNPVAGYTVTYPDDWFTNTAIGSWPACSWFSPTFFEVDDPEVVPDEVAIVINYRPDSGPFGEPSVALSNEATEVGGRPASRTEYVGVGGGFIDIGSFLYEYKVWIDGQEPQEGETGDTLLGSASWAIEDDPADYRLATAVLDRIMTSLSFDE